MKQRQSYYVDGYVHIPGDERRRRALHTDHRLETGFWDHTELRCFVVGRPRTSTVALHLVRAAENHAKTIARGTHLAHRLRRDDVTARENAARVAPAFHATRRTVAGTDPRVAHDHAVVRALEHKRTVVLGLLVVE